MTGLPALICLPPAGAGPSIFRPWQRLDGALRVPQIPGREGRFRDPPCPDLPRLADRIALEILPDLPPRFGLFGYSMGGTVAMLLARRIAVLGRPAPEALFLLGAAAPQRLHEKTAALLDLDSAGFWAEMARLGGTPPEILAEPDLRALFEPGLRHDFGLCAGHRPVEDGFRLACPVHVFLGAEDPLVGPDSAGDWARLTTGPTHLHLLPGGHMPGAAVLAGLPARIRALWPKPATPDPAPPVQVTAR